MKTSWWIHAVAPGAVAAAVARRVPALAGRPVVLVAARGRGTVVVHACPAATAAGITRGMSINDARAVCPGAHPVPCPPAAPEALACLLREVFAADIEVGGHDEATLCIHDGMGPGGYVAAIEAWFRQTLRVDARAAAAAGRLAARVAAHCPGIVPPVIMPGQESCLAPVPLGCLPWLPRRGVETLAHRWAVFTAGDLAELPGAFALKVLGREGLDLHSAVRGHAGEAGPDAHARVTLSPPTNDVMQIRRATLRTVDEAWDLLSARGLGARRLEIRLWRAEGAPVRGSAAFDPGAEDPITLGDEACRLLGRVRSRRGVAAVEIRLWGGMPFGVQLPLFPHLRASRLGRLGGTLVALRQRYGQASVRRASSLSPLRA